MSVTLTILVMIAGFVWLFVALPTFLVMSVGVLFSRCTDRRWFAVWTCSLLASAGGLLVMFWQDHNPAALAYCISLFIGIPVFVVTTAWLCFRRELRTRGIVMISSIALALVFAGLMVAETLR